MVIDFLRMDKKSLPGADRQALFFYLIATGYFPAACSGAGLYNKINKLLQIFKIKC